METGGSFSILPFGSVACEFAMLRQEVRNRRAVVTRLARHSARYERLERHTGLRPPSDEDARP